MATLPFSPEKTTSTTVQRWPAQGEWAYDDYARLPDNGMRYEVIEGNLHMSPAPRPKHQRVTVRLAVALEPAAVQESLGEVYVAPIDVRVDELADPVQPDIVFITQERLGIVKETFIEGAPDLAVEILSPGTEGYDRRTKFQLYAQTGVKEYWIIDPDRCLVKVFALRGNAYVPFGRFAPDDEIQSELLPALRIPVNDICAG